MSVFVRRQRRSRRRRAIDLDLGLTVLADACLDTDPELHRVVIGNLFPLWGDVLTVEEWLGAIAPG